MIENINQVKVSMFRNTRATEPKDALLINVLQAVFDGRYKEQVEMLRDYLKNQDESKANDTKLNLLPAFTPSGVFTGGRKRNDLTYYNQLLVLDFDKIEESNYLNKFQIAIGQPYTLSAFKSPSGNGLKVIVPVTNGLEDHEEAFKQVAEYYQGQLNIPIDESGKDVSRLCILSYDQTGFINENASKFQVKKKSIEKDVDFQGKFNVAVSWTQMKCSFMKGQRNNFIHYLACNCNKLGLEKEKVGKKIMEQFKMENESETQNTIKSAYNNLADFNTKDICEASIPAAVRADYKHDAGHKHVADVAQVAELQTDDVDLIDLPFIPEEVFSNLPDLLKHGCEMFEDLRQRDIFLTGALGVLSGCMPAISGRYHTSRLYPNLYTFITAPAASGKGALTQTRKLGEIYHKELSSVDTGEAKSLLFIPGNSSAAALTSHLQQNNGKGIFFETEADTLSNTFKQEWGNFSDLLRKAFHHENVSYSRKMNNEYIEIDQPKLSVVLSGTPGQITGLIKSAEDGLFSRFLFYTFRSENKWEDVSPKKGNKDFTCLMEDIANLSYKVIDILNQFEAIDFELLDYQWTELNKVQTNTLHSVTSEYGENTAGLVKRMGVMWFRIAMILAAIRNYDTIDETKGLVCSDLDFNLAMQLITTYKEHILKIYTSLPQQHDASINNKSGELFKGLPDGEFSRKTVIEIASALRIGTRKADEYIRLFKDKNMIKQLDHGIFRK